MADKLLFDFLAEKQEQLLHLREDISCRRNLVRTEGITNTVQELDITEDIKFTATAFSCELHLSRAELSKPGI